MDIKAVVKAESRLRVAQKAAGDLRNCKNYNDFVDTWYTLITAAKNIWTVLEQGAKSTPQSSQWFGAKARERRGDGLLQYLFEARNDDEHGLTEVTEFVPASVAIGVGNQSVLIESLHISGGRVTARGIQSGDGNPVVVRKTRPHGRLATIHPRGRPPLVPPTNHKGQKVDGSDPAAAAELALSYLSDLVAEARRRQHTPSP